MVVLHKKGTAPSVHYELTNHLGNVLAVITLDANNVTQPAIESLTDYYPFGMEEPGRSYSAEDYRYGFNGKEKDFDGLGGGGSTYDYGFRIYNPNIARFLSVDPLTSKYPWYTPYQFAGNMPIYSVDIDGLEPSENPRNPQNQDEDRDPTTISKYIDKWNQIFNYDESYIKGSYDENASVNLRYYVSEGDEIYGSINDAPKDGEFYSNEVVRRYGVFKVDDSNMKEHGVDEKKIVAYLMHSFVTGKGYENVEFPTDGPVSSLLKKSSVVRLGLNDYRRINQCRYKAGKDLIDINFLEFNVQVYLGNAISASSHVSVNNLETFMGSAAVCIEKISDEDIKVSVINITSITSGDAMKHAAWNDYSKSVVRLKDKETPYGNISQTFSFTMKISEALKVR
ncbi:MAG: hypothetical protein MJZ34_06495 [Paludibacteraceae bacterium]|nr:hypothetical protein [Paludibacteraceae bacterium]